MDYQIPTAVLVLRRRQVEAMTGLSRSAIYGKLNGKSPSTFDASFPQPIRLSDKPKGSVGWLSEEIQRWIQSRINASRPEQSATEKARVKRDKGETERSLQFQNSNKKGLK